MRIATIYNVKPYLEGVTLLTWAPGYLKITSPFRKHAACSGWVIRCV